MTDYKGLLRLILCSRQRQNNRSFSFRALLINVTVYPLLILQIIFFVLLAPVVLPFVRLVTRRPLDRIVRYFIWVYGRVWMIIMSPFVIFERRGLSRDKFPTPSIIVLNHISFFDIFCMGALPFSNVVCTLRSWPFRMFWYAPFMRLAGYVDMEAHQMDRALARCSEHLMNKASLVFFPEGHRSRDGKLARFYSGAFKLAVQTGTPIVPMCIAGTDQLLPAGSFFMVPAKIRLEALPMIDPNDFSGESAHVDLRKYVKKSMSRVMEQSNK